MPKNRSTADRKSGTGKGTPKKGSTPGPKSRRGGVGMSDEDSVCDTASVVSLNSDRGSFDDGENGNIEEFDDGRDVTVIGEALEDKIAEAIDGMTEKSANVRTNSLTALITHLSQQFRPDLILGRRETLRDNLEKIFKRGQPNEQALAATVYSLSAILVGALDPDLASEDFNAIKPCLQSLVLDHTASVSVRAKCCEALCLGAMLAETCLQDVANLLTILEPLFGAKGVKNPKEEEKEVEKSDAFGIGASPAKSVKIPKNSSTNLASAAIAGWSLLLTVMSPEYLSVRVHRWTGILQSLLEQTDLEVRLNAGEALAILVELCELTDDSDQYSEESDDEDYPVANGQNGHSNGHSKKTNVKRLISKLRELSVESHKYRAKKDRRQQHHSFRDYLHAVEDGDGPGVAIKFGMGEVLDIESWAKKRQYDAVCKVLGSGINRHLVENPLLRQIMELGSPRPIVSDGTFGSKQAKSERQYMNAMNFKVRSVNRGKNRDHRMATLEDY